MIGFVFYEKNLSTSLTTKWKCIEAIAATPPQRPLTLTFRMHLLYTTYIYSCHFPSPSQRQSWMEYSKFYNIPAVDRVGTREVMNTYDDWWPIPVFYSQSPNSKHLIKCRKQRRHRHPNQYLSCHLDFPCWARDLPKDRWLRWYAMFQWSKDAWRGIHSYHQDSEQASKATSTIDVGWCTHETHPVIPALCACFFYRMV